MAQKFCMSCGAALDEGMKFCRNCGKPVSSPPPAPASSSAPAAAVPPRAPSQPSYAPPPQTNQASYNNPQPPPNYSRPQPQTYAPPQPDYRQSEAAGTSPVMSVGQYLLMFILLAIPIVNIIMIIAWSFGKNPSVNKNKRNYARAMLIMGLIGAVIGIFAGSAITAALNTIMNQFGGSAGNLYY